MSKISMIIIAICMMVTIVVLVYAVFSLNLNWKSVVISLFLFFIVKSSKLFPFHNFLQQYNHKRYIVKAFPA